MAKKSLFFLASVAVLSGALPAFAEVTGMQLDQNSYLSGDSINVKGTVTSDTSGLVTIVLRDPVDKFVLLSQAMIGSDDSFEKDIAINDKFQIPGTYNATAFVLNMTAGKTQSFNFDTIVPNDNNDSIEDLLLDLAELEAELQEDSKIIGNTPEYEPEVIEQPIKQEEPIEKRPTELQYGHSTIADFVDKTKEPEYYLERYYNEPAYQSWFDRNYPNLTIEEAVGYTVPTDIEEPMRPTVGTQIVPEAEAISVPSQPPSSNDNSDLAQMGLALGGLAVLFGAVYGIKRKVDNNTKHISLNKDTIREKIISPIFDSNPQGIIRTRLAKGEISIEEYEKLKEKLDRIPK